MDKDLKDQVMLIGIIIFVAICSGVAAYLCMTPEQRASVKEKHRIEYEERAKHPQKEDDSFLSDPMKLIIFKTIF